MLILESPWMGLPGVPAIVNGGSQQANGLLAALPLNAGAVDVTGKTGASVATTKFGLDMGRGAQQFDGAQDIRLGSVAEINAATNLTMCAWFRPSSFANAYNTFLSNAGSGTYCDLHIRSNGKLALYALDTVTGRSYDGTGTYTLAANTLYFIALTASNTTLSGYINAELDGSVGLTNGLAARSGGVATIGNNPPGFATRFINGRVRDVRFYNRALTQGELREIYLAGNQLFAPQQIIIPTAAAAASSLPTLSASTYVPGSLTSTGWRPRVTATY